MPYNCTIGRFRQHNSGELKKLFSEVLRLCAETGMVKLGHVSLDVFSGFETVNRYE